MARWGLAIRAADDRGWICFWRLQGVWARRRRLSGATSTTALHHERKAEGHVIGVEGADASVAAVCHVEYAIRCQRYAKGIPQVAVVIAIAADGRKELASREGELFYAAVVAVGDVQSLAVGS